LQIRSRQPEYLFTGIQRLTKSVELKLNNQGSDIYNAKKILKVMGYEVATVDNNFDKAFETALKKYQTAKGLNVNGVLDIKTQIVLNEIFCSLF
jgi:peptidoglycan hydrolase-like protein with peptidoglycan-binding domain